VATKYLQPSSSEDLHKADATSDNSIAARPKNGEDQPSNQAGRPAKFDRLVVLKTKLDAGLRDRLKAEAVAETERLGRTITMSHLVRRSIEQALDSNEPISFEIESALSEASYQLRAAGKLLNMFMRDFYIDRIEEIEGDLRLSPEDLEALIKIMKDLANEYGHILSDMKAR